MSEDPQRYKPLMHPAGLDVALARVLSDVAAGRWMGIADLLSRRTDLQQRCTRVTLLAKIAAGSSAVEEWLRERPGDGEAIIMAARVTVERACRAIEAGVRNAWELAEEAELQSRHACTVDPADPVPRLGLLALACARGDSGPGPQALPVSGPWDRFLDVWRVDRDNREAHHRMMTAVGGGQVARPADAQLFARSTVASSGLDIRSPLQLLPLFALVGVYEHRRRTTGPGALAHLLWTGESARQDIERGWAWFERADPGDRLVMDMSHLAHALCASGQYERAAEVFEALGPYGAPRPWNVVAESGDGTEMFVRNRIRALMLARQRPGERSSPPRRSGRTAR